MLIIRDDIYTLPTYIHNTDEVRIELEDSTSSELCHDILVSTSKENKKETK